MAGEEPLYTEWLARQRCARCDAKPSVPHHHTGRRGLGQRAHDRDAIPVCASCHRWVHEDRALTRAQRREWQDRQVEIFRGLYTQQCFDTVESGDEF